MMKGLQGKYKKFITIISLYKNENISNPDIDNRNSV